jgi:hypothetical protein
MRPIVLRSQAALTSACLITWSSQVAYGAPPQTMPTHFAGEALTVALAFCFPALAAGAYLGLQKMTARLGARSISALCLALGAIGATAYLVEDAGGLLQRAGLASLPR